MCEHSGSPSTPPTAQDGGSVHSQSSLLEQPPVQEQRLCGGVTKDRASPEGKGDDCGETAESDAPSVASSEKSTLTTASQSTGTEVTEDSVSTPAVDEAGGKDMEELAVVVESPPPTSPAGSQLEDTVVEGESSEDDSVVRSGEHLTGSTVDRHEDSQGSAEFTGSESSNESTDEAKEARTSPIDQPGDEATLDSSVQRSQSPLAVGESEGGGEEERERSLSTHDEPLSITSMSNTSETPSHISLPPIEEGSG